MNLKTTFAMTAIALAMTTAAQAEEVQVYGKVNVSLQHVDDEASDSKKWEVKSNASRFGIKGDHEISEGLTAFYKLEWQVDVSDESKEKNISARNQIVGLKGGFGTLFTGRHDTPFKKAQNKIDLFNDLEGDIKNLFQGENRMGDLVQYSSPKFGGVQINAAIMPGEEDGSDAKDNGIADAMSASITYSKGDLYLAYAQDWDVKSYDGKRLVAQYKMGNWVFGGMYQESEKEGSYDEEGTLVSAAYKTGKNKFKFQYGDSDMKAWGRDMMSIGWDYKLSKKANTFVFYTARNEDEATMTDSETLETFTVDMGKNVFGAGLVYKF